MLCDDVGHNICSKTEEWKPTICFMAAFPLTEFKIGVGNSFILFWDVLTITYNRGVMQLSAYSCKNIIFGKAIVESQGIYGKWLGEYTATTVK